MTSHSRNSIAFSPPPPPLPTPAAAQAASASAAAAAAAAASSAAARTAFASALASYIKEEERGVIRGDGREGDQDKNRTIGEKRGAQRNERVYR